MSAGHVTVRMYKRILGDCFLITVAPDDDGGQHSHILIDCGVLQGTEGGKARMIEIVEDIEQVTGGRLDLVVVTHEHFDHISGFDYARDIFERMTIEELWFAWTENPNDEMAGELQQRFAAAHASLAALALAREDLAAATDKAEPPLASAPDDDGFHETGIAGFRGLPADAKELAEGTAVRGSRATFARLRKWAGRTIYLEPGDIVETPARDGGFALKAYVLGPPRDPKYLFQALPSKGDAKETYLEMVPGARDEGDDGRRRPRTPQDRSPFAPLYRWHATDSDPRPRFVREHYYDERTGCRYALAKPEAHDCSTDRGCTDDLCRFAAPAGHDCATDFECDQNQAFRKIEDLAIMSGEALALKLDSNTNNTSLVLAFETPSGETMIFAADAQVGNWLSWEKVRFRPKANAQAEFVRTTSAEMLANARLYKVGHHGSHNATLRAKGLEAMTGGRLAVMIPTVEEVALEQGKKGWLMPNPETYKGIIRQTRGRIMRGDKSVAETRAEVLRLVADEPELEGVQIDRGFEPHDETDDYVDFRLLL